MHVTLKKLSTTRSHIFLPLRALPPSQPPAPLLSFIHPSKPKQTDKPRRQMPNEKLRENPTSHGAHDKANELKRENPNTHNTIRAVIQHKKRGSGREDEEGKKTARVMTSTPRK
jgi:hypothetical protein